MPVQQKLIATPKEEDEHIRPPAKHTKQDDADPSHPLSLEDFFDVPTVDSSLLEVNGWLPDELNLGYGIHPLMQLDEPGEDAHDYSYWGRHGSLLYDYYED